MEQRIALTQGSNVKQYIIDDVIGFGASCLVYRAHFLDNANHQKDVILKECYPYNAGTTRIGNKIIWSNTEERDTAFQRFHHAYDVASEIQNTANAKSVSAYSLEILNENGTQYVITIPNGDSYDKTKSNDIADIVRTALALTNAVGLYHKAGYLHLDIKPSNFIATADQTGQGKNIVLFDVDSVVSIGDIQNGKLRGVSYSKEYAAPEQKQQKVKCLCPATDLFSVGAVLFERIMNRRPDCTDSCMFAEWEFDSRFDIKNVKPKAKRLLTEIFHKTLSANIKRRYQSADELAAALEELRKVICEPAPYIYSYPLDTTCHFVGRSDELAKLHCALEDSSLVFVRGVGGIGKTELMRKYLSIHQDEYDAVVFMLYNGSVSECLQDIEIIGVDSQDKDKKSLLKEICDNDKILLVLDNYDVAPNESEDLEALLDLNCKVIVTTRTDFTERNPSARFIEVAGLSEGTLQVIFENESELTLSNSEFEELKPILSIGKQCTYFWSMIARLVKEGAYTVSEIAKKVSDGLEDLEESEEIFDTKDGSYINTTVAAAMLMLFKLDELGDKEFEVLNALYFLDCLNMDKRQIKEMLSFSSNKLMNSFNILVKKGYIQKLTVASREVFRISDVLRNVLEYKVKPDITKSVLVTTLINNKLYIDKEKLKDTENHSRPIKDYYGYIVVCLFKIFSGMKWTIPGNAIFCIDKLYNLFAGESRLFRCAYRSAVISVMNRIQNCLDKGDITQNTKTKIFVILISYSCFLGCANAAEDLFWSTLSILDSNQMDNTELMDNICKPIVSFNNEYFLDDNHFSLKLKNKIQEINPPCFQYVTKVNDTFVQNYYNSPDKEIDINDDEGGTIDRSPSLVDQNGDYNTDLFLTSIDKYDSQDYVYYFISEFSDMVRYHFNSSELDVDKCIAVAGKLEKMLSKYGINGRYIESYGNYFSIMDYNEVQAKLNLTIAIMYNKLLKFDTAYMYLSLMFESLKSMLHKTSTYDLGTERSVRIRDYIFFANRMLDGQLVVPLLYSFIKFLRKTFNITDDLDERMYSYYKSLVTAAEHACSECEKNGMSFNAEEFSENDPRGLFKSKEDYTKLIKEFSNLFHQISGQEYYP